MDLRIGDRLEANAYKTLEVRLSLASFVSVADRAIEYASMDDRDSRVGDRRHATMGDEKIPKPGNDWEPPARKAKDSRFGWGQQWEPPAREEEPRWQQQRVPIAKDIFEDDWFSQRQRELFEAKADAQENEVDMSGDRSTEAKGEGNRINDTQVKKEAISSSNETEIELTSNDAKEKIGLTVPSDAKRSASNSKENNTEAQADTDLCTIKTVDEKSSFLYGETDRIARRMKFYGPNDDRYGKLHVTKSDVEVYEIPVYIGPFQNFELSTDEIDYLFTLPKGSRVIYITDVQYSGIIAGEWWNEIRVKSGEYAGRKGFIEGIGNLRRLEADGGGNASEDPDFLFPSAEGHAGAVSARSELEIDENRVNEEGYVSLFLGALRGGLKSPDTG